jgi:hypothetical protein
MGAESSTVQSVERLGQTLVDIERKLTLLEANHIQRSSAVSESNTVWVSGRSIECRPWVHLTVGPVIGLIGQTYARILIETDQDSCVSVHTFQLSPGSLESSFVYQDVSLVSGLSYIFSHN